MKDKLSNVMIKALVAEYYAGFTNKSGLGKKYGVSARTVGRYLDKFPKESIKTSKTPFEVGDLVTGIKNSKYFYTNSNSICEVIKVFEKENSLGDMVVKILSSSEEHSSIVYERTYSVKSDQFTKIGKVVSTSEEIEEEVEVETSTVEEEQKTFKVGDRVKIAESFVDPSFYNSAFTGKEGSVGTISREGYVYYFVTLDCGVTQYVRTEDMELLVEDVSKEEELVDVNFTMTSMAIALTLGGNIQVIDYTHPMFNAVKEAIQSGDYIRASEMMDIKKAIEVYSGGRVKIKDGIVSFDNREISNKLTSKMLSLMEAGDEGFKGFARFFDLVMQNPSLKARERLMDFVAAEDIGLNEGGHIVAFKNVGSGYKPSRSGVWVEKEDETWEYDKSAYYDNSVGSVCKMPRSEVDDIEANTCSHGLHVCSVSYLKAFWGTKGHTMKVTINPADVVAIPPDYNNSKARVCKYTVVEEVTDNLKDYLDKVL